MTAIPPGKGSDWQEREAWVLNPPSMSDRANPSPPGGTFVTAPVPDVSNPIPRNYSSDYATRDVNELVSAGGTPQPPVVVPPPAQSDEPEDSAPWTDMTKHADIDQFVRDNGISVEDDWNTLNIANKKQWLDENYTGEV